MEVNPNNPAPYLALGESYGANGQGPESVQAYSMGLEKAREHKDIELEGALLQALGAVYSTPTKLFDYKKALEYYEQALIVFEQIGCMRDVYHTLNVLGGAYLNAGNYEQALEYYQRDLEMATRVGNKTAEACSRMFIGRVYRTRGDYEQALEYFTCALELYQQPGVDDLANRADIILLLDIGGTYKK